VHAVHHKSVDVNPFSSYSFHFAEAFLLGGWVLPVILLVPIYLPMLGVLQGIGLANNVMSHLGYEFLPRWLLRVPLLRWMNTSTFHNLHHTSLRGNYGLMFRWWDRWLGTEVPNYEATFVARGTVGQPEISTSRS
jgi:sterol desaturase/sphingolipid hydroxylase (fatty acid hydroxylase superfamily)